ncbi:MAG: hypothetical protein IJS65_07490, partial [Clostridia bacterium]|nr:hypothetical protein [Clostridia bacterium]
IDSINAVTGARISHEMIRTNEKSARVTAVFENVSADALKTAEKMGVSSSDGVIILDREIYSSGRNVCRINGFPATIQMLKDVGFLLININGQHDGLRLLDESLHIDYLDAFAKNNELLDSYGLEYEKLLHLNRRIKALSLSEAEKEKRLAEIDGLLADLADLDLKENEWEDLKEYKSKLRSEEKLVNTVSEILTILDGSDETPGACAEIMNVSKLLSSAKIVSCEAFAEKAGEAFSVVSELSSGLSSLIADTEYSEENVRKTDERISKMLSLASRCSCEPSLLLEAEASMKEERDALLRMDENIEQLKEDYLVQRGKVTDLASRLHDSRENAAKSLSAQMEEKMSFLNMPDAKFSVDLSPVSTDKQTKFTKKGTDKVLFLLSANRGEELKPLSKVASGGELSRIMLSFKNVISEGDENVTTVFDEVDAGVSGKAASRVAHMLSLISEKRQVLCVTHLPQIACAADNHYRISKETVSGRTVTRLELLDKKGRIEDVSRLIGGEHVTDVTRRSAEQMIMQAKK